MVYVQTILKTLDNSGARYVQCIKTLNKSLKKAIKAGQKIVISVKKIIPRIVYNKKKHLRKKKTIQKGEVHLGIVVCCSKQHIRNGWLLLKMEKNTVVIVNKQLIPYGSRVLGPVMEEVRAFGHVKIVSLSSFLI